MKTEVNTIVDKYCDDIIKNKIPSCRYVKKAVQRYKNDIKRIKEDSWDYILDWEYVQQFYEFSKSIKLPDRNEYLNLLPWQLFCIANLIGWKYKYNTEKRRFRSGTIYVPRKNGKTTGFMYPLLLWDMLTTESSESYLFAKDDAQAGHFLNDIKKIVSDDKNLSKYINTNVSSINLKKSKISCFSSETVGIDGYKPSMAIIDEYWCFKNERCVTAMRYGGRARLNSLVLIITTCGLDISLPAYTEHEKVKKILNNLLTDESYFGIIYEADENMDWKKYDSYIMANPSIDKILDRKILEQDLQDAILTSSHQQDYKAKTLNWWVNDTSNWISIQKWDTTIRNKPVDISEFNGEPCWASLDLSSINDFTAYTKCFFKNGMYYLFHKFYIPSEQIQEKYRVENIGIIEWLNKGYITATEGQSINYDFIREDIINDAEQFNLTELSYDKWNSKKIIDELEERIPNTLLIQYDQSLRSMSSPTKSFEKKIYDDAIVDGSPIAKWMLSNATIKIDVAGNYKPLKEYKSSTKRIDSVITSIIAVDRCEVNMNEYQNISNKSFDNILNLFG